MERIYLTIEYGKAWLRIYPFIIILKPKKVVDDSCYHFDWISIGELASSKARYWKQRTTFTFLFFQFSINFTGLTIVGKLYPEGYHYSNDPEWREKLETYQKTDEDY